MTSKKKYEQPDRLAGLEDYGPGAAITVRFVDNPAPRGEQSISALDMARNFDALPDMEQERLTEVVRQMWEAVAAGKEEQRRLERLDWLLCAVQLRREGMSAEEMQTHTGDEEAEIQSLLIATDAVERWLGEDKAKRLTPEGQNSDVNASVPATPLLSRAHAGTPGEAYLTEFLPNITDDADWLAESINNGTLLICPRCHFLRLQGRPFPLDPILVRRIETGEQPAPVDGCDVCAMLPEACRLPIVPVYVEKALKGAAEDLTEQREKRALLLYALWEGPVNAADALLWARMGQALEDVRNLPWTGGKGNTDACE